MASFEYADTFALVTDLVSKKLNAEQTTITRESTLQDLGADSLDTFEIILKLQDRFGVEIEDSAADSFSNVGQIAEYIHSKRTK